MHETHLIEPIIRGITQHAAQEGAKQVSSVRLKIGQFMGLQETPFRETFALLSKGTILEKARLELTFSPGSRIEVLSFDVD
jgi:Zn finger protein HypA/HybF involved in hydrogenase expression